ncbi:MAG: hypothetical protein C5S49_00075 [Candidatus Methanogaster sp.]|nr:MAG: hypothetical protein C5S49_00075 [ANME-2 cluster archaeon]
MRKGSKKVHIKTSHFEFGFHAKRTLDEVEKNVYNTLSAQPGQKFTRFHTLPFVEISAHNSPIFGGIFSNRHLAGD